MSAADPRDADDAHAARGVVAPPAPSVTARLRAKAPELLLEALSIVFAVLLALGVDEWREGRQNQALAARARESILAEIRANRGELVGNRSENDKVLAGFPAQLERLEKLEEAQKAVKREQVVNADARPRQSVEFNWQIAQLSSAAWQAAQATQATQFMDYKWLVGAAQLYEVQRLYTTVQDDLVLRLGEVDPDPLPSLKVIHSRMKLLQSLDQGLSAAYAGLLRETAASR